MCTKRGVDSSLQPFSFLEGGHTQTHKITDAAADQGNAGER